MSRAEEIAAMPTTTGTKMLSRQGAWLVDAFPNVLMRFVDERNGQCFLTSYDESPCYGWFDLDDVSQAQAHTVVRHGGNGIEPLWYEIRE